MADTPRTSPTIVDIQNGLVRTSHETVERSRDLIRETDVFLESLHLPLVDPRPDQEPEEDPTASVP